MEGMIHLSAKKMSLLALFIALSVIGASIKIPAVIGSVALDVFPALFASVLIGKRTGAVVAGLGHILTALRSEEHTSELQSRFDLVCRLLLETKKIKSKPMME